MFPLVTIVSGVGGLTRPGGLGTMGMSGGWKSRAKPERGPKRPQLVGIMFEKLAKKVVSKKSKPTISLEKTREFVETVREEGFRLSYAALASVARILGEDSSTQIPAQRGAALVKVLPVSLHPTICRKSGGYKKEVFQAFVNAPEDLLERPVLTLEEIAEAVSLWEEARS